MKLSEKLSELAQSTADPLELVEKCREAGIIISTEQAQKLIDTHEMTEISEDNLGDVAGGNYFGGAFPIHGKVDSSTMASGNYFGCTCSTCGQTDQLEIDVRTAPPTICCKRCNKAWRPNGQEFILEEAMWSSAPSAGTATRTAFSPYA